MKNIIINGTTYVPLTEKSETLELTEKSETLELTEKSETLDGLTYCIIRTYSSGVWAGYCDLENYGEKMKIKNARRLWRWWSEFTLSALAKTGIKEGKEDENKYAMPVDEVYLVNVIEIIPCTETAKNQIIKQPNYSE